MIFNDEKLSKLSNKLVSFYNINNFNFCERRILIFKI